MSTSHSPLTEPAHATEPATMWQIARRPRWIGALILSLAIAASFAALGQWQLSRSLEGGEITVTRYRRQFCGFGAVAAQSKP